MPHCSALFIDGGWRAPSSREAITVRSPATEQVIGHAPCAGEADVDAAVAAARRALTTSGWRHWTPQRRAEALDRLADALEARAHSVAAMVTNENGMPISMSTVLEGFVPTGVLRYYAGLIRSTELEERRPAVARGGATVVRREPAGVVAAIVPWNAPSLLTSFKLAPALAAGCTLVLKPSPETALDSGLLAEAVLEAGLPAGVVNIVPGGRETGEYLVSHPGVDKVAFTGSSQAGRRIGEVCGRLLRPVSLELGGKSAAIVLEDADLQATAQGLASASLTHSGQYCYLSTRVLAPRSRYREVLDAVTDMAASLVIGDPLDPGTQVGPLISRQHRRRVESVIAAGVDAGATVTTGGRRPKGLDQGWFLSPTVLGGVDNTAPVAREEIFGPVLVVIPYTDVDEAVTIANDSEYGLAGTVWTADVDRGLDLARRVETGTFGVNSYLPDLGAPFGGVKSSGLGRELGPEGLAAYFRLKSVYLPA